VREGSRSVVAASGVVVTRLWKPNKRSTCTLLILDVNAAEPVDSIGRGSSARQTRSNFDQHDRVHTPQATHITSIARSRLRRSLWRCGMDWCLLGCRSWSVLQVTQMLAS
jgi:hypothetical protein